MQVLNKKIIYMMVSHILESFSVAPPALELKSHRTRNMAESSNIFEDSQSIQHAPHLAEIRGPMLWTRETLSQDRRWIVNLDKPQLDELDQIAETYSHQQFEHIQNDPNRFPECARLIDQTRDELNRGRGVVLFRGIDARRYEANQLRTLMWTLGIAVGDPMIQNARGELLGEVTDYGHDYQANNVRGYTTRSELAFHCDASEIVALLCVHPARQGGHSKIVCSAAIHNEILATRPELLAPLYRGYHFDLRGEGATGDRDEVTRHRVPIFHYHEDRLSIRFNYKTIVDGMRKAGKPVEGLDLEALNYLSELSKRPDLVVDMQFEAGDIQWLSNHDVLHARDEFLDWDEPNRKRRLYRMWLTLPHGRSLRPEFIDRFNNGPKRGPKPVPGAGYWAGA